MNRLLLLACTLVLTASAQAQTAEPADAASEGIHVSGEWTIEVRNPDGTLAERHDFHNALFSAEAISQMLAGETVSGSWAVVLQDLGGNNICEESGTPLPCWVLEQDWPNPPDEHQFINLTVAAPTSGPDDNRVVLSGTAIAQRTGIISAVRTEVTMCNSAFAPSACSNSSLLTVTSKVLDSAINVVAGQTVNVRVVLGFN